MLRKSISSLVVCGGLALTTSSALALTPQEAFVLTGVYDEMRTCFAYTVVAASAAKAEGDAADEKRFTDQGFTFMKGYEFFGKTIGKGSSDISADVASSIQKVHEQSENLTKMVVLNLVYLERCDQLAADPKPIMEEYMAKYGGPQ